MKKNKNKDKCRIIIATPRLKGQERLIERAVSLFGQNVKEVKAIQYVNDKGEKTDKVELLITTSCVLDESELPPL